MGGSRVNGNRVIHTIFVKKENKSIIDRKGFFKNPRKITKVPQEVCPPILLSYHAGGGAGPVETPWVTRQFASLARDRKGGPGRIRKFFK